MKTIRFWTSHACKSPVQWSQWLELDSNMFRLVHDPVAPDWLFGTEHIYLSHRKMAEFLKLLLPERRSLYFASEAVEPDMNIFDYALVKNRHTSNLDRLGYCPIFTFNNYLGNAYPDLSVGTSDPETTLRRKTHFCSFIYSNPHSHFRRDWIFRTLSQYKKVDSLGPHLHNCDTPTSRFDQDWKHLAIKQKSHYKFDIAAENACFFGYTTEKIMSSFMSRAIPIYWGNPLVVEEFNPEAFINANGMEADELLETVRRIDEDNSLWCRMVSAPPMTPFQVKKAANELDAYRQWTSHVFGQSHEDAMRRPEGTWAGIYQNSFKSSFSRFIGNRNWTALPSKIKTKLGNLWN